MASVEADWATSAYDRWGPRARVAKWKKGWFNPRQGDSNQGRGARVDGTGPVGYAAACVGFGRCLVFGVDRCGNKIPETVLN